MEVLRLQAARAGDDASYKTASDGGATGGPAPPPHNEVRRNIVQGWSTEDRPPPPPPPPRPVEGGGETTTAFRLSEALRNLELPSLPPPGGHRYSLGIEGARLGGSPGSAEEASQEVTARNPSAGSSASRATGEQAKSEEASGLLTEVAGLLKSLRSIRALHIKYAAAKKEAGEIGATSLTACEGQPYRWLVGVRCCTSMPGRLPF